MNHTGRYSTAVSTRLFQWRAEHDNGWATVIVQRSDHLFAAWAMTDRDCSLVYVGADIHHACAAVMSSLYWKSGHRNCTAACSEWGLHGASQP